MKLSEGLEVGSRLLQANDSWLDILRNAFMVRLAFLVEGVGVLRVLDGHAWLLVDQTVDLCTKSASNPQGV